MSVNSISSSTISSILQNTVTRLQSQLTAANSESSTGLLADIGLTLGANAGQDVAMHQQMADLSALTNSNAVVTAQLGSASAALTSLSSATQTMLQKVIHNQTETSGSNDALALQQNAAGALSTFTSLMYILGRRLRFRRRQQRRRAHRPICGRPANGRRQRLSGEFRFSGHLGQRQHDQRRGDDQLSEHPVRGSVQRRQLELDLVVGQRHADEQSHRRQSDGDDLDRRQSIGVSGHGAGPDHDQRIRRPEPLGGRHGGADDLGAKSDEFRH